MTCAAAFTAPPAPIETGLLNELTRSFPRQHNPRPPSAGIEPGAEARTIQRILPANLPGAGYQGRLRGLIPARLVEAVICRGRKECSCNGFQFLDPCVVSFCCLLFETNPSCSFPMRTLQTVVACGWFGTRPGGQTQSGTQVGKVFQHPVFNGSESAAESVAAIRGDWSMPIRG